jgi:hypothetical protein
MNQRIKALETSIKRGAKAQAKNLRRIRRAEVLKKVFGELRNLRNPYMRKGITRIEVPIHQGADPRMETNRRSNRCASSSSTTELLTLLAGARYTIHSIAIGQ